MRRGRYHRLFSADSVALSVGVHATATVVQRIVGLGRGVVVAWLLPQGEYGLLGVSLLMINVLLPACSAGLYEGVMRYAPAHEAAGTLRIFTRRAAMLVGAAALISGALLLVFSDGVGAWVFSATRGTAGEAAAIDSAGRSALFQTAVVCVITLIVFQTLVAMLRGLRMFRAVSAAELAAAILFTGLAITLPLAGFDSARAVLAAYALSNVAGAALFLPGLIAAINTGDRDAAPQVHSPFAGRLLAYSAWAAMAAVLWHAMSYFPVWLLLRSTDAEAVGTFHAVRTVTQLMQVGAVMLTAIVAANATRLWERQGRDAAEQRLGILTDATLVAMLAGGAILAAAKPVVMKLFPAGVAADAPAFDTLLLFFALVGVVGLLAIRMHLLERPQMVCWSWLLGVVVMVGVGLVAMPVARSASELVVGSHGAGVAAAGPVATPIVARAISRAAWAGVAGAGASVLALLVLLRLHRFGPSKPTLILVGLVLSLGAGWIAALAGLAIAAALAAVTQKIACREGFSELRDALSKPDDR